MHPLISQASVGHEELVVKQRRELIVDLYDLNKRRNVVEDPCPVHNTSHVDNRFVHGQLGRGIVACRRLIEHLKLELLFHRNLGAIGKGLFRELLG